MFYLEFKKLCSRIVISLFLVYLMTGSSDYTEIKISKSKTYIQNNSSGGKSSHTVKLKAPNITKNQCISLISTVLKYKKQRFGEAKISSQVTKGCNPEVKSCEVKVSWKHAPVGHVHYWLQTSWEIKSLGC